MGLLLRPSCASAAAAAAAAAVLGRHTSTQRSLLLTLGGTTTSSPCCNRIEQYVDYYYSPHAPPTKPPRCDVFINHRGVDTKQTVAGLLYDRLVQFNLRPFLDNRSMQPGDKLYESINSGILSCRVGIAIFSPRYCESLYCLHELAMLVEAKKKLIPIFFDVKPSQLHHLLHHYHKSASASASAPASELMLKRFSNALQEARNTVGLTFDSHTGNWSELVSKTANIVVKSIKEGRDC